jgi:hypothetical protein
MKYLRTHPKFEVPYSWEMRFVVLMEEYRLRMTDNGVLGKYEEG